MSLENRIQYSHEETLRLLTEKAKTGGDRFMVKVSRKRGVAGLLEHHATLIDATVEQLANPETWLPTLCGGGEYGLRVSHMDDVANALGGVLLYKFQGAPFDLPRTSLVGKANWTGPGGIVFPSAESSPAASSLGGTVTMAGGSGLPPTPYMPASGVPAPPVFAYDERVERERERLQRESRELAESKQKAERQLAEREFEIREKEREAKLKDELTAKQRDLEAKINAQQAQQANAPKLTEIVSVISAAFAPVVTAMLESSKAARVEQLRIQEEAARRQAEMQQRMMEMQQQSTQLLVTLMKDKGPDPTITTMMEMMRANSQGGAEMMTRIVDAMGTVSKTSVGMIEAIADLRLGGEPENPILGAVRETVKALATLSKGAETGARKQVAAGQKQPQLPSKTATQPKTPTPTPTPTANGAAAPTQPVVYEAPNVPQPNHPPATEAPPAFAEAPRFVPQEGSVIEQLKTMIEARHEPVEEVAQFFVDALQTNELREELKRHSGDVNSLVAEHLGLWVMSDDKNREYIGRVGRAIDELGTKLGLVEDNDEDEAEAEEA